MWIIPDRRIERRIERIQTADAGDPEADPNQLG
jgi:hypothetical protein